MSSRLVGRLLRQANTNTQTCLRQSRSILRTPIVATRTRAFTVTSGRLGRGAVDKELSAKLASEYAIETEMKESDEPPAAIQEFIKNGPFTVTDVEGNDEVILERKFGNETIRIVFSVSDMNNMDESENETFDDPDDAAAQQQQQQQLQQNEGDAEEAEDGASFPVRCNITIQKDGTNSVLSLDTITQDGIFIIDNMVLYPSIQLATGNSAEYDWQRREKYMGPPFSNLDEDLQILMERFLEERGINTSLALFVPDYVDYKEGREYENWLQGLQNFVDV